MVRGDVDVRKECRYKEIVQMFVRNENIRSDCDD